LPEVAYTLSDMAADGIGVLDHLGIDRPHIAGVSMGGMIVQTMAIEHPDRVLQPPPRS
jgi:pimeloyl-ACP methyl ester carboxylesterase